MNHTDTMLAPASAPTPTMSTRTSRGYAADLRQHLDDIKHIATTYVSPNGRIDWEGALEKEPQLESKLLVGPGTRQRRIKRIVNLWTQITGKRTKYQQRRREAKLAGVPVQPPSSTTCNLFDGMRQRLEVMAQTYRGPSGRTAWSYALANSPDIAQEIGYAGATPAKQRRLMILLGFWYRDRLRKGNSRLVRDVVPQGSGVVADSRPLLSAPTAAQPKLPRFCAHCGEAILYATR